MPVSTTQPVVRTEVQEERDRLAEERGRLAVEHVVMDYVVEKRLRREALEAFLRMRRVAAIRIEQAIARADVLRLYELAAFPDAARLARPIVQSYAYGAAKGTAQLKRAGIEGDFGAVDRELVEAARAHAGEFVTGVTAETRQAINGILQRSLAEGFTPRGTARLIKQVLGLTEQAAKAVLADRMRAVARGATEAEADRRAERYANDLLVSRAKTIARTETTAAIAAGIEQAWRRAQRVGALPRTAEKVWVTASDEATCETCLDLDGEAVPLAARFNADGDSVDGPPAHPNCRCGLTIMVREEDVESEPLEGEPEEPEEPEAPPEPAPEGEQPTLPGIEMPAEPTTLAEALEPLGLKVEPYETAFTAEQKRAMPDVRLLSDAELSPDALNGIRDAYASIKAFAPKLYDEFAKAITIVPGEYTGVWGGMTSLGPEMGINHVLFNTAFGFNPDQSASWSVPNALAMDVYARTGTLNTATRELWRGVTLHEFGHFVDRYLDTGMTFGDLVGPADAAAHPDAAAMPAWVSDVFLKGVATRFENKGEKAIDYIGSHLTDYGASNPNEGIAEIVASILSGRELSDPMLRQFANIVSWRMRQPQPVVAGATHKHVRAR